jgi:hypothetical protein
MRLTFPYPRSQLALALLAAFVIAACHGPSPFEVYGPTTATFSIAIGQDIDIHMQTVGPGDFGSPPTLSGSAIEFLGVGPGPGTNDPGGIVQVFHFKGVVSGRTIVTFQRVNQDMSGNVVDTVTVQCFAIPPACQ